jgi:hypothetical protein
MLTDTEYWERKQRLWEERVEQENPIRPSHYTTGSMETWDAIHGLGLGYLAGNVVKYLCRYPHKGEKRVDLLKARAYLDKLIQEELGSDESSRQD